SLRPLCESCGGASSGCDDSGPLGNTRQGKMAWSSPCFRDLTAAKENLPSHGLATSRCEGRQPMADPTLAKDIKRPLYTFARRLASPFTDSRRRGFLRDMLGGLVIGGHVHLTRIARAVGDGTDNIHGVEERLSNHLGSEHWDMSPLGNQLLD